MNRRVTLLFAVVAGAAVANLYWAQPLLELIASDLHVATTTGVPVGFGLLTCDNPQQARDRSGLPGAPEDKGREATLAALETAVLLRALREPKRRPGL